jgi:hypothetical protein
VQPIKCSLVLSTLVACSMDPQAELPPEPQSREITITVRGGAPQLVVARDDADGLWFAPESIDATTFRFVANGPYRVAMGCDDGGFVLVTQVARTLDDDPQMSFDCLTPPGDAMVVSTMVQPGAVEVGNRGVGSQEPNWEIRLEANAGTRTVIAHSDDHVAILRGVELAGETTLPAIDVVAQGAPLTRGALAVQNADQAESLTAIVMLDIDGTTTFLHQGDPANAKFATNAGSGEQYIQLIASTDDASRFAYTSIGGATTLVLPEPLAPVSFVGTGHDLAASWDPASVGTALLSVYASTSGGRAWLHQLVASETYVGGSARVAFELDGIPLPEAMLFDPATTQQRRELQVWHEAAEGTGASRVERVNPSAKPLRKPATGIRPGRR